jgi:hypothetical protein
VSDIKAMRKGFICNFSATQDEINDEIRRNMDETYSRILYLEKYLDVQYKEEEIKGYKKVNKKNK